MRNLILDLKSILLPSEGVVAREIEGDVVIVPLVAGVGDADGELYTLNETGKAIWRALDGERNLGEVAANLMTEFQGVTQEIENDVLGFATELVRRGMLIVRE